MQKVQVNPNQISHNTVSSCGYCIKTDQKLLECARCHFMWYCNDVCQKKHWPTHKPNCYSKYIHVVQDGAAILSNKTTKNIHYLFTNGLESCIAIMAKGEHGVALLHDGGRLTKNSIKDIFQRIGTLEFWVTSAYPSADQEYSAFLPDIYLEKYGKTGGIYLTKIERIYQIMTAIDPDARSKQKKPTDSEYYRASQKWACIDRNGEIFTQKNSNLNHFMPIEESTLKLRQKINELNSATNDELNCHLQFDGEKFTPIPQLIQSEETIQSSAKTDSVIAKHLNDYRFEKAKLEHS